MQHRQQQQSAGLNHNVKVSGAVLPLASREQLAHLSVLTLLPVRLRRTPAARPPRCAAAMLRRPALCDHCSLFGVDACRRCCCCCCCALQLALWWSLLENCSSSVRSGDVLSALLFLLTASNTTVGIVQVGRGGWEVQG